MKGGEKLLVLYVSEHTWPKKMKLILEWFADCKDFFKNGGKVLFFSEIRRQFLMIFGDWEIPIHSF